MHFERTLVWPTVKYIMDSEFWVFSSVKKKKKKIGSSGIGWCFLTSPMATTLSFGPLGLVINFLKLFKSVNIGKH